MGKKPTNLSLIFSRFELQQKKAAEAVGVTPSMMSRWINDQKALNANSPRTAALAGYILSRELSRENAEWLIARFREARLYCRFDRPDSVKEALINLIANDGSRFGDGKTEPAPPPVEGELSCVSGVNETAMLISAELSALTEGQTAYLYTNGEGAELRESVHAELSAAVSRGLWLRVLLSCRNSEHTRAFITLYLKEFIHPNVRVALLPERAAGLYGETFLILPGRAAINILSAGPDSQSASLPVASVIRRADFTAGAEARAAEAFAKAEAMFLPAETATARFIYQRTIKSYENAGTMMVVTDGLNPQLMSREACRRYLERRGCGPSEIKWRLEDFTARRRAFEQGLRRGMRYMELCGGMSIRDTEGKKTVAIYGDNLIDDSFVDLQTALDIYDGYTRLLSVYPSFSVRFAPVPEPFEKGCWILDGENGLIMRRKEKSGERMLYSGDAGLKESVRALFAERWDGMDYRAPGKPNTVEIIRRQMEELKALMREDGREEL